MLLAQILPILLFSISKYAEMPSNFQVLSHFNFGVRFWDIMFRSVWELLKQNFPGFYISLSELCLWMGINLELVILYVIFKAPKFIEHIMKFKSSAQVES